MNTKWRVVGVTATVLLALIVTAGVALAVHDDGLFQLDYVTSPTDQGAANVSHTNISPAGNTGDDWDQVYAGTSSAFATAFIQDPVQAADHSFFTGGGSKDVNDVPAWQYGVGNNQTPDKDDIVDAFAAAYAPATGQDAGHIIFYFGADRFDNSGDSQLGFWFFRSTVTLGPNGAFNGVHQVGDILVLADFVNGGQAGKVTVYKWVGGQNPLQQLFDKTQADCSVAPANDPVCAVINNSAGETPPWPYMNKSGSTSYGKAELFEGGIDVNDVLGVSDVGCFSTFLAETRSSHSTTAQLKDLALGGFPVCSVKVTKTGDTLSKVGDPVDYTVTIENTGHATLYKRNISDTLLGAITTDGVNQSNPFVLTNTCGASLAPGATCTITLRRTVQAGDPDPLPNTVSILYSEHSDFTGLEFTSSADWSVNLFQPAVMIEKTGDGLSKIGDDVTYTFTITNKSSQDSPDLNLASISDNVLGDLSSQATTAGCDVLTYNEVCSFKVTRTVQAGDGDPLNNQVDVLYHPDGFPNDIKANYSHSVNLFQPSVSIEKTGNELSKIGDSVMYHFKITNTSSLDSPNLVLDSISDDVLGDLSSDATSCASLAPEAFCEFDVPWTVTAVDVNPADGQADDPVINTVTIHFHPDGFLNDIAATGSHSLNLFQPSITFTKTADTQLSKATDAVNYTLTLNNTSSPDTPDLVCTVTDAILGVNKTVTLASGGGDVTDVAYTVQAGDPDPLVNNASVSCSPTGFPNVLTGEGSWKVNLFQPSVKVDKSGDTLSKIGDSVTYHFKITNTSSADSPDLKLDSVTDNLLGTLMAPAACDNLAPGASCEFDVAWTVAAVDVNPADGQADDPVINTVTIHFHPVGFTNDIAATGSHSLNLFQPSITFTKTADTQLSKATDVVNYTLTLNNTSSPDTPDLVCTVTDAILGVNKTVTLASGAGDVTNVAYTVKATDADPLVNNASVSCSPIGFSNVLTGSGSATVELFQPSVKVTKTGPELSKVGDVATFSVMIENTSSMDSPNLVLDSFSDSLISGVTPPSTCNLLESGASCSFNYSYTVQAGDPDPLVNTATAHFHPDGFTNDITNSSTWSTNLFQPSVKVTKTGPELSKVGDVATFNVKIENTSSMDSPNLVVDSFTDTLVPGVTPPDSCSPLVPATSCSFSYDYTVQAGDPDPLVNIAAAHFHPDGFTNDITNSSTWSTNLFQPSITFSKTADTELSKVTDGVKFTLTLNNTSSADTPDMVCKITDALLELNGFEVTLASSGEWTKDYPYTVQAGDPDPLVNNASVSCSPTGFPNVLTGSGSATVELFQPSVKVTKTGPAFSKAGDVATFNVKIENTSSMDSPNLVLDSFNDTLVSGVTPPASCSPLVPATSCSFSYNYTVQAGDPDPLVNTATAHFHPDGFTNDITNSSTWSTDLLHPGFTAAKACKADTEPISQAGPAIFTITFNNTGDADMHVVPSEGAAFDVAAGGSTSYNYSVDGPFSDTVNNTVTGKVTLAETYGLSNSYTFSVSGSCIVEGKAKVAKTVNGQLPAAGQTFTFQLRQGASTTSDGTPLEEKTTDASGNISFATSLVPGQTYQICEWVFPGWNTNLAGDGPLFVPNSIIPPSLPNPNVNNLTVCTNFTVTSGQTRTFNVDNTPPPGGRALTIGFWKNWASCANSNGKGQKPMLDLALAVASQQTTNPPGGLVVSAQNAGSGWPNYASLWYLVLKGDPASTKDNIKPAPDCLKAVNLLNKTTIDGKTKKASDPLFNMTAQLVGAQLNRFMSAGISGVTITNIDKAVLLDGKYKFKGLTYSPKLTPADANLANCLATQLDNYNNDRPVSSCP